jgi:hypothetical protein
MSMHGDRYQLIGALAFLIGTLPLPAQQLEHAHSGVTRAAQPLPTLAALSWAPSVHPARPVRRWPFILGGAVVGSAGAGVWLARSVKWDDDGMILPVVPIAAIVTAGAGIGALGGWAVSAIVGRGGS